VTTETGKHGATHAGDMEGADPGDTDRLGNEPTADPTDEYRVEAAPEDAFGLVANETRVGILQALWEVQDPLTFSQLRDRVGVADSGQFNYHLSKLAGRFVRKVDGDTGPDCDHGDEWPSTHDGRASEGYVLTYAGRRVVTAIVSGTFTESATVDPFPVGDCYRCRGQLTARYAEATVTIACEDCGAPVTKYEAPPNLVRGYEREELPAALSRWAMTQFETAKRGFCPFCAGRTHPTLGELPAGAPDVPVVEYECETCGVTSSAAVSTVVLTHPEVVAFHDDHGIDLTETPPWELEWLFAETATVESEDPCRIRIAPSIDGDEMHVTLDGEMQVIDIERPE